LKWGLGEQPDAAAPAERAMATMLSLDLARHPNTHSVASALVRIWQRSGQPDKAARLAAGDISDLLPAIAQIEAEHRAWAAEEPENRDFGPPSPFGPSHEDVTQIRALLAKTGIDVDDLARRVKAGQMSKEDFAKIVAGAVEGIRESQSKRPKGKGSSAKK
jgi:hypothetical protein